MSGDGDSTPESRLDAHHIRCLRVGHGANCSSVGSVVDILFATAALGSAVFAAVVAALAKEPVVLAGDPGARREGDGDDSVSSEENEAVP